MAVPSENSLCRKHSQEKSAELQIPRLRSPGFPVELGGAGDLMRLSLRERRTRGFVQCCVAGNPGRDDKGEGDASMEVCHKRKKCRTYGARDHRCRCPSPSGL